MQDRGASSRPREQSETRDARRAGPGLRTPQVAAWGLARAGGLGLQGAASTVMDEATSKMCKSTICLAVSADCVGVAYDRSAAQLETRMVSFPLSRAPAWINEQYGQKVSLSAVRRWVDPGLRGVRLATFYVGGRVHVTEAALAAFLAAASAARAKTDTA